MRWRALRPVGESISIGSASDLLTASCFSPAHANFYSSGTAALAVAIQSAVTATDATHPEVILPAYGCPSLVAATLYAGAKPVLADFAVGKLFPAVREIEKVLTTNTVAIVQVDLFGLPSLNQELRDLASNRRVRLIHDCAQACISARRLQQIDNELVILSFGRGKPISLLGGGALLRRSATAAEFNMAGNGNSEQQFAGARCKLAILRQSLAYLTYNLAIWPPAYNLIERLPLGLGETRFSALQEIKPADPAKLAFLPANFHKQTSSTAVSANRLRRELYQEMLTEVTDHHWVDMSEAENIDEQEKLLRYPLLAPNAVVREQLMRDPPSHRLGLTAMYRRPLAEIEGIPTQLALPADYPNANNIAARLVTLPLHEDVTEADITQIGQLLSSYS